MKNLYLCLLLFAGWPMGAQTQKQVAITIDDIFMARAFLPEDDRMGLLRILDAGQLPVAIFISEGHFYKRDTLLSSRGISVLGQWLQRRYVTAGSHSFHHWHYSDTSFEAFKQDIQKGLSISRPMAKKYQKPLRYFRFPFNDLGGDSLQHLLIRQYLQEEKLILTPFSVESEDWAYNYVYEYYLSKNDAAAAKEIAARYVEQTLNLFAFMETVSKHVYGRVCRQIYLCHDNLLNEHCLPVLFRQLKARGYEFIGLDEAIKDPVYQQEDHYYKKWGMSWLYRLNLKQLGSLLKKEPDDGIAKLYEEIKKQASLP